MNTEEIGSVGKAPAGDILIIRKVYLVTMVQPSHGSLDGFQERYDSYWNAVDAQVSQLEAKAGVVARIFAEGVIGRGDDAMLMLQQSNPGAHRLVRQRVTSGAVFEEFENKDLFGQVIDWARCLQSGLISRTVVEEIQANYNEVTNKRNEHLQKRLEEGIRDSEAALLLGADPGVKLPDGVERFFVSPPELDELERWVQQANEAIRQQIADEQSRAQKDGIPDQNGKSQGSGDNSDEGGGPKLWTPG